MAGWSALVGAPSCVTVKTLTYGVVRQVAGFHISTELSLGVVASTLSAGVAASLLLPEVKKSIDDGGGADGGGASG